MAESYGFFDAEELLDGTYDREYAASEWANYFKLFIGNGVFATPTNQLKVRAVSGMNIKVLEGWAFLNGFWYHNDGDLEIAVPPNLTANTQNHGIFVQFDSSERTIAIILGEDRTQVNRTAPIWELKVGEVAVPAGATAVTDANITDTRANNSVCGFVTGLIDVITTADLFAQYQAIFDEWIAGVEAEEAEKSEDFDDWREEQQNSFDTWFDEMKGQLSTDAAGNLQNQIDLINENFATVEHTSTSSRAYAVGEHLIFNKLLCRVTSAISQGDTLAIGTNLTAVTVDGELLGIIDLVNSKLTGKVFGTSTSLDGLTVTFTGINPLKDYLIEADLGTSWDGPDPSYKEVEITSSGDPLVYSITYTLSNAEANQQFKLIELG